WRFEWLTLWHTRGPLPVNSQRRAIAEAPCGLAPPGRRTNPCVVGSSRGPIGGVGRRRQGTELRHGASHIRRIRPRRGALADDRAAQLRRTTDVLSSRSASRRTIPAAALILAAPAVWGGPAPGQGRFEAHYSVTIAGIPVGQGVWVADIAEDQYTTAASGRITGLARVLTDGEGFGAARGRVHSGRLVPASYALTVTADRRPDEVRIAFAGGGVKDLQVWPPTPDTPGRVPVTEAHRRGVVDPLSAGLLFVGGTGEVVSQDACRRTVPIFDGRQRYDL